VGHLARKHAHFSERNFEGFVGNFNLNWAVTGKTRITAGWARNLTNFQLAPGSFSSPDPLFPYERFSTSYVSSNRFFIAPIWQISEKIAMRLRYDFQLNDHLGAVESLPRAERVDTLHSGLVAVDWQPLRALLVTGQLQRDHRSSSHRGFDYDSAAASVSARLNF
jgi:hypothetical protein